MSDLSTDLFDYSLPQELIAQSPVDRRDQSRLLVVDRAAHTISHRRFSDLPEYLRPGDTLFRNNAAVLPARLKARRPTGGEVECFLLEKVSDPAGAEVWRCLLKPGRKLEVGATFSHESGAFKGTVEARQPDGSGMVRFEVPSGECVAAIAQRLGSIPLPPYIVREDDSRREVDRERYQTVYADPSRPVAVAAPTAGLHFTPDVIAAAVDRGARFSDLTLHVGLGTFRPIATQDVKSHPIHRETYEIGVATQRELFGPRSGRRIAVGTTSVRSIEDFLCSHDAPLDHAYTAEAKIYLYPPTVFGGVDALITNFHQPRSTLLCLVSAFLAPGSTNGIAWFHEIYAEAISLRYRFFSYGDAMLIL